MPLAVFRRSFRISRVHQRAFRGNLTLAMVHDDDGVLISTKKTVGNDVTELVLVAVSVVMYWCGRFLPVGANSLDNFSQHRRLLRRVL